MVPPNDLRSSINSCCSSVLRSVRFAKLLQLLFHPLQLQYLVRKLAADLAMAGLQVRPGSCVVPGRRRPTDVQFHPAAEPAWKGTEAGHEVAAKLST